MTFFIEGHPAPGGSKTVFPVWRAGGQLVTTVKNNRVWPVFRVVDDAGENNKKWKAACTIQARSFMQGKKPYTCAIEVEFTFFLTRPKTHYRTGQFAHLLRDDAPEHHLIRPDALKFARSTEDGLTKILWDDDSQNVFICARKRYRLPTEKEGCLVKITLLNGGETSPHSTASTKSVI